MYVIGQTHLDSGWELKARCRDTKTPEIFEAPHISDKKVRAAKAICRKCPVRSNCLDLAMATDSEGVFGGTTKDQRDMMRVILATQVSSDAP